LEDRWVPSTLTVTNNLDSGAGSLRAEIAAGHNGDTIVFNTNPSLGTDFSTAQTITLTSGEVLINKSLSITGLGAGKLTVSGNNASRVFEVARTVKQDTLSGLTISNGSLGYYGTGAGILNNGSLTVSGCIVSSNVTSTLGYCGGICNQSEATLTVSSSTVSGNSVGSGGGGANGAGIFNYGKLTVTNSILSNNQADGDGGGIDNRGGTVTVSGSTLSNNTAQEGGGISNEGTMSVTNTTLSGGDVDSATVAQTLRWAVANAQNGDTIVIQGHALETGIALQSQLVLTQQGLTIAPEAHGRSAQGDLPVPITAPAASGSNPGNRVFAVAPGCPGHLGQPGHHRRCQQPERRRGHFQ
jgi:hypothetical protein